MKRIEASTLEEAYKIACDHFACSMKELKYEIIQYPSSGFLGLFSKTAIIIASKELLADKKTTTSYKEKKKSIDKVKDFKEEIVKEKPLDTHQNNKVEELKDTPDLEIEESSKIDNINIKNEEIVEQFFEKDRVEEKEEEKESSNNLTDLALEIENKIKNLMELSCFDIDTVEVDVRDNTAYIFLDGDDAALLIGKEGYRYNALSYLLFSWLHSEYQLFVKLEIAQFLSSQQEMIRHTIKPVIEHVEQEGWGRTRPLDGILVQIALEQLREEFPNKYVAIKRQRDGSRYILINEFNNNRQL